MSTDGRWFASRKNKTGPKTDPCRTPLVILAFSKSALLKELFLLVYFNKFAAFGCLIKVKEEAGN